MWCPVVAPRKPPQAPCSSHAATQPAASEPGPSTPPPAKRSKRTEAEPAAEPTQPTKGTGKGKGEAVKAKPAPQPSRWLDRDCNAAMAAHWEEQGALPAKGKEYPGLGYKRLRDKPPKAQQQLQPAAAQQCVPPPLELSSAVQRLRDVEQSLMGTVDGLQGDLDDLQAAHQRLKGEHTALQQVASRAAASVTPYGLLDTASRRLATDSHGRPMGSMPEQLSPAGLAPSPTDIFIPTQEAPRMGQLRAEVRRKEDATAAAQRSAKAECQITEAAHKVGRVVVNVGDHACQERLAAAHALAFGGRDFGHTTVEEAMKKAASVIPPASQHTRAGGYPSYRATCAATSVGSLPQLCPLSSS
ncbi:hypothetical protein QJQ45_013294 [Haematococcus lacustris]|nr:hypothetical protein QJQ45_013294 [Haematococcus lacustris]